MKHFPNVLECRIVFFVCGILYNKVSVKHNLGNANLNKLLFDKNEFKFVLIIQPQYFDRNTLKDGKQMPNLSLDIQKMRYWTP